MLTLDAAEVAAALPYHELIDELARAFGSEIDVPLRTHHEVPVPGGNPATLLLMPAWQPGGSLGVKIATIFPDNAALGHPSVFASYILMSAETGVPEAILDGSEITLRRTAAASALASTHLSREDASSLLMVGTGSLAPHLIGAHASARPLSQVLVWGRRREAAEALVATLQGAEFDIRVADDLAQAAAAADVISCATLASEPLIRGAWLRPGQHLDLVGAFRPEMREADSEAVARAAVYVDTRDGVLAEGGDIVQAIADGSIGNDDVKGELRELVTGTVAGRATGDEITLFKSVGTAIEDLAAAELAFRNHRRAA